jgi:hypothetical protein
MDLQLLGGAFSPLSLVLPSCQIYQSLLGLSLELRLSLNQANTQLADLKAYLVTAVVDDEIHDQLHAPLVTCILDLFPVLQSTISRVDLLIVGDIVTHVGLRRLVHWREPYDIDTELVQVRNL